MLNATAAGVIRAARAQNQTLLIAEHGILGLVENRLFATQQLSDADIETLAHTPSSAFGSCRYKLPEYRADCPTWQAILRTCAQHEIDRLIIQGGNDSQDTTHKVTQAAKAAGMQLRCIGLPKTIDNDLVGTDFSPGFPSAAKYCITSVLEASLDTHAMARSSTKVFIMEVMGRHSGWLALSTCLAQQGSQRGPHLIAIPEVPFLLDALLQSTAQCVQEHGHCIMVVAEGVINAATGQRFATQSTQADAFGHAHLGGVAPLLAQAIQARLQLKCHWAVPDYLQRSAAHLRSAVDFEYAHKLGEAAVAAFAQGQDGILLGLVRQAGNPCTWKIQAADLAASANAEKTVPASYYDPSTWQACAPARNYFLPLIAGEVSPMFAAGIPRYFDSKALTMV